MCKPLDIPKGNMDTFLESYLETAAWSSTDENGEPLDSLTYADVEWSSGALAQAKSDCQAFIQQTTNLVESTPQVAHDFWLTRNHHGSGFLDGDYPKELGEQLTKIAHSFGECNIYVGDDKQFYFIG
jgi:hypothetical protein